MADNLQQRMDQAAAGTPLVNPDEQRKYLGTFRERCYVSMTIGQMKQNKNQALLTKALEKYPQGSILMNGCLSATLQTTYMKIATQHQTQFKIVTTSGTCDDDKIGLLIVSEEAVHQEVIDIEELFAITKIVPEIQKKTAKKGFWSKIF